MSNIIRIHQDHPEARNEVASSVNAFIARAGVSKSAVAREIGMAQSTFSRRTTGAEPFDVDELGLLAAYFEVSLVDLISGDVTKILPNAKKAPTPKGEGQSLPKLDSNQQPAGSQPGEVIPLKPRTNSTPRPRQTAKITALFG